jgi:CHASE3 domain sensor protein
MGSITKLSHKRVLLLLIITPLLLAIELVIGFLVYTNIQRANETEARNAKLDLYLRTNTKYISYAESAQRGYLLTGETKYRDSINFDFSEAKKNEEYYSTLPNEVKTANISAIQATSRHKMERINLTIALYDAGKKDSALAIVKTGVGNKMMDSIRAASTAMRTELADQVSRQRKSEIYLFSLFLGLIAVLIFFNLFLVWYTYRKFSQYTESLEQMVTSLQEANDRMAQYTAQSYHELKTPLRNINGFAQLLRRRHISAAAGSDEDEFITQITDGVKQMNQTINDMRSKYLDTKEDEMD